MRFWGRIILLDRPFWGQTGPLDLKAPPCRACSVLRLRSRHRPRCGGRRPLPFPVSLHATEHNDGRPQESTEKWIESDPRAHGNNAQLRQRLPGSNYFTGSPGPRKPDLGERPPPIFPDTWRPHRGPTTISRPRSALFGPGRFGRRRRSPSRRWSSSHPCGRTIRRSGRRELRVGGRSRCSARGRPHS